MARLKLDVDSLRARFDKPRHELGEAEARLVNRWGQRAQDGRDFNFAHYQHYLALDKAWDANFYQSTTSLAGFLRDMSMTEGMPQVEAIAKKWNMTHLLANDADPKTNSSTGRTQVNVPVICTVILGLGRAYTMTRVSRLVNERLATPLMKFEPAVSTEENKVLSEFITQGIATINREFLHADDFKIAVQGAGKYGQQIMFPREEWYKKTDYVNGPVPGKEGQRYAFPHPFRTYYDTLFPLRTLNSDTGCRYLGFWDITTYEALRLDPHLWNRDRISRTNRTLDPAHQYYLQTSCGCRFSNRPTYSGSYVGQLDPVAARENVYYTRNEDDQPVWVSEHFEKINPRRDFDDAEMPDEEFWFRVRLASDDTPIYMACLPDRPAVAWLWEPDDTRVIQEGQLIQVVPFQDQLTNLLAMVNLGARQNLANLSLINTDAIPEEEYKKVLAAGTDAYLQRINVLPMSFNNTLRKLGINTSGELFATVQFPKQDVSGLFATINLLLSLLERVTGMSAQEVGSYASHEQSAAEIHTILGATSARYEYIAAWIDTAFEAWKTMLYSYWVSYGSMNVALRVDSGMAETARLLGVTDNGDGTFALPPERLRLGGFISQRDGPNRVPWMQLGSQMVQLLTSLAPIVQGNPSQMVKLLNEGFSAMGLPKTFRLQAPEEATPDTQTWVQGELEKLASVVKDYVDQKTGPGTEEPLPVDTPPMLG